MCIHVLELGRYECLHHAMGLYRQRWKNNCAQTQGGSGTETLNIENLADLAKIPVLLLLLLFLLLHLLLFLLLLVLVLLVFLLLLVFIIFPRLLLLLLSSPLNPSMSIE